MQDFLNLCIINNISVVYRMQKTLVLKINILDHGGIVMDFEDIGCKTLLRDKIYNKLKEAIVSGELGPGERIIETKLAEEIGISRTPIREAIRRLESEGYLESMRRGGVKVTKITEEDIKEWSEIKNTLNELAVKKAVERIKDEEIEELEECLIKAEQIYEKDPTDKTGVIRFNANFHQKLFEISGIELIKNISSEYQKYTYMMRKYLAEIEGRQKRAITEHRELFEAIKERDKEKAIAISKRHSENSKKELLDYIEERNKNKVKLGS